MSRPVLASLGMYVTVGGAGCARAGDLPRRANAVAGRRRRGGIEASTRAIDGIDYSVRAWKNDTRRLHVSIPVVGDDSAGYVFPTLHVNNEAAPRT
jgi:hypothetical protein